MRVVTPAGSRDADARTIASGTPGLVLMERAATAVAREIASVIAGRPERGERIVVVAGPGNNGGDGFAVARLLGTSSRVGRVITLLAGEESRVTGDAATMLDRLRRAGGDVRTVESGADLEPLDGATVVVDALFGTGLTRPVDAASLAGLAIARIKASGAFVVAVDIASGLDGGTSAVKGPHVVADLTVTFGAPKVAHADLPAAAAAGRIVAADIGLLAAEPARPEVDAIVSLDVAALFPRRDAAGHKGTYGRLVVVGGSAGMAGAPALASRAALRAGAGLVSVAAPDEVRSIVHLLCPEATTLSLDAVPAAADALAVGPGLGTGPAARAAFEAALGTPIPAVFDADGLNLAAAGPEVFRRRFAATVLTPHPGEAGRLLGCPASTVNSDRPGAARELASRSGAVVVLKGFRSIVAASDGRTSVVLAGNPGMATGGAGDVLTGIVGALLARGLAPFDAASAGAWLHGTAGDLARERYGEESLVAGDLVELLEEAFQRLRGPSFR